MYRSGIHCPNGLNVLQAQCISTDESTVLPVLPPKCPDILLISLLS